MKAIMDVESSRRDFIKSAGAFAGVFCLHGCASCRGDRRYSVAVLGDTHYDAEPESVYHSHYDESNKWAAVQHEEFRRNGEMWRERCRRLLESSAVLAGAHPTRFVLQMGDIIQGDCDDVPTHRRMLDDCISMFRAAYPADLPLLTVMGNHDVRGKGARQAYLDYAAQLIARETARLTGVSAVADYPVFSFRFGPDRWVFCDFETQDLQPVIDAIESDDGARHVFLVTHGPFTISEERSFAWRLGGGRKCDALRPRLYEALSRRRAVVLSGHTHLTTFSRHENAFGGFCEFTANSVWKKELTSLATGEAFCEDPSLFGATGAGLLEGERLDRFKRELELFRPGVREYFNSRAAGHFRLDVSDEDVTMSYYQGADKVPARRFALKHPATANSWT